MGRAVAAVLDLIDRIIQPLPPTVQKLVRYSVASGTGVAVYLVILILTNAVIGWGDMPSHLVSVGLSSIPNYLVNRYWTWSQKGKNRLWGEVVPFWTMAFLAFLLSLLFVNYAEHRWGTTFAIAAANLSAFGVLWLARFLVLDKIMWKVVHELHPELDDLEVEIVHER
jgi:putative flippase GtrA